MTMAPRWLGLCALALAAGCAAHRRAGPVHEHTCDPSGAQPPIQPRYEAYVEDELYPDELALRSKCALPRDPYAVVPDDARLDDERYREAVARDPVPLADAEILERCSMTAGQRSPASSMTAGQRNPTSSMTAGQRNPTSSMTAGQRAPASPGACRRACVADARARAARVLFVRSYDALRELAAATRTDCAAPGTDVRRCAGLEFLPPRMRVDASGGTVRIRGPLIAGGRVYELTLAAQDAGCGVTEVAPLVRVVDPLAGP